MSDREDDLTLINFLRQHQGFSPPPNPDLEARIMDAVDTCPRLSRQRRYLWMVPSAIAVGSALTWAGYQFFIPVNAPLETAEVAEFWAENWDALAEKPRFSNTTADLDTAIADELLFAHPSGYQDVRSAELVTDKR